MTSEDNIYIEPLVDLSDAIINNHPPFNHKLDGICAMCIRDSNDDILYELFIDNETQTIFNALIGGFDDITLNASHTCIQYQFIDIKYTLFRKQIYENDQNILFLMVGEEDESIIHSFDICDCISHLVLYLYQWLKLPREMVQIEHTKHHSIDMNQNEERMSLQAMIEILNEIFCESADSDMELNELQFILCMQLRLGLRFKWKKATKPKLQRLYQQIVSSLYDADDVDEGLTFTDFMQFLSQHIEDNEYKEMWNDIKSAIYHSPLSAQNQLHRAMEVMRDGAIYETKLDDMKILINLLQDLMVDDTGDDMSWWVQSVKDEIIEKIYVTHGVRYIMHKINEYCNASRNVDVPKRFVMVKMINVTKYQSKILYQCDASMLIAGYVKCSAISQDIQEIIYGYFDSYTIIDVSAAAAVHAHVVDPDDKESDYGSMISELSDTQNDDDDDDDDDESIINIEDHVWDMTREEIFYDNMVQWLQYLENGRFRGYVQVLIDGFKTYGVANVDDLNHLCSAELSDAPFRIKRFVDKRDLVKHFKRLKVKQYHNNFYQYL